MIKYLLALLLVPLLTACPEMEELNKSITDSPIVTAKRHSLGDCKDVRTELCTPEEFGLYYSNDTYAAVTKATYESAKIGDPK